MLNNAEEVITLIHNTNFDITKPSDNQKYKDHMLKNRQLGSKIDKYLTKSNKKLTRELGIDLIEYIQHHQMRESH